MERQKYGDIKTATAIAQLRAMRTGFRYEVWQVFNTFRVQRVEHAAPLSMEAEKLRTACPDGEVVIW